MSDNDNSFGAFLAGLLIGGLVGAVAALLLAPQSGEETRTQIKEKSIELRDKANASLEDTRLRASESMDVAKQRMIELQEQVKARGAVPLDKL